MEVGAWEPKIPIRSNGSGSCGGILDRSLEALEANGQTSWFIDIRDLLAESLEQRPSRDDLEDSLEGR